MPKKKFKTLMSAQSKRDLLAVGDYIAYTLMSIETSEKLVKGIRRSIKSLEDFPKRYSFVDDAALASDEVRCMPYHNYYIFYRVIESKDIVLIMRIGFNRRNWKRILMNEDN